MLPSALPTPGPELHVPVLPDEVRELLAVRPGDTVVDCTFGAGGHAALLAHDLHGHGKLVAIDRDPDAKPHLESFAAGLPVGVDLAVLRT
jgi:16S rRNA (cytosine1402-N4)-methyltransferase